MLLGNVVSCNLREPFGRTLIRKLLQSPECSTPNYSGEVIPTGERKSRFSLMRPPTPWKMDTSQPLALDGN
ncbi:hypothetical protein VULLAG_LOCUS22356 [Vulpes lagopus]